MSAFLPSINSFISVKQASTSKLLCLTLSMVIYMLGIYRIGENEALTASSMDGLIVSIVV